ncbi:MAG: MFS transporter, partial [Bacilli bacterium]
MDEPRKQRVNFTAFLIHALFLALTLNFIDINTVVPNMLAELGGTAMHMGILSAIMVGGTKFMQLV